MRPAEVIIVDKKGKKVLFNKDKNELSTEETKILNKASKIKSNFEALD